MSCEAGGIKWPQMGSVCKAADRPCLFLSGFLTGKVMAVGIVVDALHVGNVRRAAGLFHPVFLTWQFDGGSVNLGNETLRRLRGLVRFLLCFHYLTACGRTRNDDSMSKKTAAANLTIIRSFLASLTAAWMRSSCIQLIESHANGTTLPPKCHHLLRTPPRQGHVSSLALSNIFFLR